MTHWCLDCWPCGTGRCCGVSRHERCCRHPLDKSLSACLTLRIVVHTPCRAAGPPAHATDADAECENPSQIQAIWSALCEGTLPPLLKHRPSMGHDSSADKAQDASKPFSLHQMFTEARFTCLLGLSCNACPVGSMHHVPDMNQESWPACAAVTSLLAQAALLQRMSMQSDLAFCGLPGLHISMVLSSTRMSSAGFVALAETARLEKHVKNKLAVAADHFNRDYKKGFQFLQVVVESAHRQSSRWLHWLLTHAHISQTPVRLYVLARAGSLSCSRCTSQAREFSCICHTGWMTTRLLLQTLKLLPEKLDAVGVARFMRNCPGLSKQTIGDLLGDNDDFFLEVLDEFTQTFDFAGGAQSWLELLPLSVHSESAARGEAFCLTPRARLVRCKCWTCPAALL